jgi:shikimate dehydrogenase
MRQYGLIGYPLTQSFSKTYFDTKFEREGLADCRFDNFPLKVIQELPTLLNNNPQLRGLAVTIPHKQTVLSYLHESQLPEGLSACNCIRIRDGKLTGYNTDHLGFEKSFLPLLLPHHKKALVLGNGGATAAVIYVLQKAGIEYDIVSRNIKPGSAYTYNDITENLIRAYPIIINTTPLGMYPETETLPPIPYESITPSHLLYDLVYNPSLTRFLEKGALHGATIINGKQMLEIQAEENWRIWNQM